MKIGVVAHKGGAGKTTTAVHIAAYLQKLAPTVLFDTDESVIEWEARGGGLPFTVAHDSKAGEMLPLFQHAVIDTAQAPSFADLETVSRVCDRIVIPAPPAPMDIQKLARTINTLRQIGPDKFVVLLTKVADDAAREAEQLRKLLAEIKAPVLKTEIPYLKAYLKASGEGQIVNQTRDRNAARAWEAYRAAGKEIARGLD